MRTIELPAFEFLVASLAVWRVAHLLHGEDGPWMSVSILRRILADRGCTALQCFLCVSVWPALPAAALVAGDWRWVAVVWPALSAGAILIERAAFPATFADTPQFIEDQEIPHVLRPD